MFSMLVTKDSADCYQSITSRISFDTTAVVTKVKTFI